MPNIWVYVVGGIVAIGAIVSIQGIIGENEGTKGTERQATNITANAKQIEVDIPEADATFNNVEITKDDFVLGMDTAPITVIEYASLTCPHCAQFHQNALPTIKKDFIQTGKIRYIFRDFPLDQLALSGSMIALCSGRDRYFAFIETLFAQQSNWVRDPKPFAALSRIARLGGLSQAKFDACIKDKGVADAILKKRLDGDKIFGINSTPTIIINGKRFSGGLSIKQFKAVIAPLLK